MCKMKTVLLLPLLLLACMPQDVGGDSDTSSESDSDTTSEGTTPATTSTVTTVTITDTAGASTSMGDTTEDSTTGDDSTSTSTSGEDTDPAVTDATTDDSTSTTSDTTTGGDDTTTTGSWIDGCEEEDYAGCSDIQSMILECNGQYESNQSHTECVLSVLGNEESCAQKLAAEWIWSQGCSDILDPKDELNMGCWQMVTADTQMVCNIEMCWQIPSPEGVACASW